MKALFLLVFFTACLSAEIQENSLLHKCWTRYSQSGEEGVIAEMVDRLKIENGVFVEFGACDGVLIANTRFLAERGWSGAFIEAQASYIPKLIANCQQFPKVQCVHAFITSIASDGRGITLDTCAERYFPHQEIDVLSMDTDGEDYLILERLKMKPKLICIETSGFWHPLLNIRVPDSVASRDLGQPLPEIIRIAKAKGYTPVCFLVVNLFLVRNDYAHLFSDIKNDPLSLWSDSWEYMRKYYPNHIEYIRHRRAVEPDICMYDRLPIPPIETQ